MTRRQCAYVDAPNHSADLLAVYHGRPKPTYLCGYHEQRYGIPASAGEEKEGSEA